MDFFLKMISQSPELSGMSWYNLSAVQLGLVVCFLYMLHIL